MYVQVFLKFTYLLDDWLSDKNFTGPFLLELSPKIRHRNIDILYSPQVSGLLVTELRTERNKSRKWTLQFIYEYFIFTFSFP